MHRQFGHFKLTLYLTLAILANDLVIFFYLASHGYERASAITIYVVITAIVAFGLWVQIGLTRFVGAAWFLLSVFAVFWPIYSTGKIVWDPAVALFFVLGILSLVTAFLLLFSRKFKSEFYAERNNQPAYKRSLKRAFIILLIIVAAIATAVDIYHLAIAV